MKFLNNRYENEELTYEDVFLFQWYFDGTSRFNDIDITPSNPFWTSIPIVSANMNAVTWKRMAEALARLWWLWILPQDMDIQTMTRVVNEIKWASIKFDTPITVRETDSVHDALWIIYKRSHNAVILVDDNNKPLNIFTPKDLLDIDQYTKIWSLKKSFLVVWNEKITDEEAFLLMDEKWISSLPIVWNNWELLWILTKKQTIRNSIYKPNVWKDWKFDVWVALWVNSFLEKAKAMRKLWVSVFVLDTAHWFQKKMIEAIKAFRSELWDEPVLIAWNVITEEWTEALLKAWANWVKVGVWPWAMCTTRIKTWVWRPQLSAVVKCSRKAKELGWFVWADWWIKEPRDVALALAAWANHVMIWTLFSWTFESTWDIKFDESWRMYKENYWMASRKAVSQRNSEISSFELAKKELFREWISTSKIFIKDWREWVWDIVDEFMTWLRSSMTYVGASDLSDFYDKAILWVQTWAWFVEWTPHWKIR